MDFYAPPLLRLIEQFRHLPGIGQKSAQRLAFHVLSLPEDQARAFADAILEAKAQIHYCSVCWNLTDGQVCAVCRNEARDHTQICVVEDPRDVVAMEKTREYRGVYHVLHGAISPMDGVGPGELKIRELLSRVGAGDVSEIIMATNPTVEGEATAMYLSGLLKPLGVRVTRLAYGIPVGGGLEFADEITLLRAFEGRREL